MPSGQHPTVTLHLGAHKTATSYLQETLAANAALLAMRGIHYVPHRRVRLDFTNRLDVPKGARFRVAKAWQRRRECAAFVNNASVWPHRQVMKNLILSDENLLDFPNLVMRAARLEGIAPRLEKLAQLLRSHQVRICVATRNQADLANSLFSEVLCAQRDFRADTAEVRTTWLAARPQWSDLFNRLHRVFPQAPVTVWRYEDLATVERSALGSIADLAEVDDLVIGDARPRTSLSRKAADALLEIQNTTGVTARRAAVDAIRAQFPVAPDNPKFSLWTADEDAAFQADYDAEFATWPQLGPWLSVIRQVQSCP